MILIEEGFSFFCVERLCLSFAVPHLGALLLLECLGLEVPCMKRWITLLNWFFCSFLLIGLQIERCGAMQFVPPQVLLRVEVGRDQSLVLRLLNQESKSLEMSIASGSLSQINIPNFDINLDSYEQKEVTLTQVPSLMQSSILHLQTEVLFLDQGLRVQGPFVFEVLRKTPTGIEKQSYGDAFLSRRVRVQDPDLQMRGDPSCSSLKPCSIQIFSTHPVPLEAQASVTDGYAESQNQNQDWNRAQSLVLNQERREEFEEWNSISREEIPSTVVRGHLSLKLRNRSYQAAQKVGVTVFWLQEGGGVSRVGSTSVKSDGSWQVISPLSLLNQKIRVLYKTQNEFFTLNDPRHQPYVWSDELKLLQRDTDLGFRSIDLSLQGDLPGLDEVYLGAIQLWSKLSAQKVNVLRKAPVEVVFPNSLATQSCILSGPQGPYPWSCSYWNDGKIFLIPAHANKSVIQHELAHSIHSFFWKGQMPEGSGGVHNLWECFHPGLALTEGFADFMAYWAQYAPVESRPIIPYFDLDIETLPEAVCSNLGSEMRVASTFWDLYDSHVDGLDPATAYDQISSPNWAAPISLFLSHPRNTMLEFLEVFQSGQSSFTQSEVKKVFKLNRMVSK
jgi:hypothetical protein